MLPLSPNMICSPFNLNVHRHLLDSLDLWCFFPVPLLLSSMTIFFQSFPARSYVNHTYGQEPLFPNLYLIYISNNQIYIKFSSFVFRPFNHHISRFKFFIHLKEFPLINILFTLRKFLKANIFINVLFKKR